MRTFQLFLGCAAAVMVTTSSFAAIVTITPTSGVLNVSRWEGTVPNNPKAEDIFAITGIAGDWVQFYKSNVEDDVEEGPFQGSYNVDYSAAGSDPDDPNNADVLYQGGPIMDARFLIVKDGNQIPIWYVFDLDAIQNGDGDTWDGQMLLMLRDFWPSNGAISHIEFIGQIPEPTSLLCWSAFAMGSVCLLRRRKVT